MFCFFSILFFYILLCIFFFSTLLLVKFTKPLYFFKSTLSRWITFAYVYLHPLQWHSVLFFLSIIAFALLVWIYFYMQFIILSVHFSFSHSIFLCLSRCRLNDPVLLQMPHTFKLSRCRMCKHFIIYFPFSFQCNQTTTKTKRNRKIKRKQQHNIENEKQE